MRNNRGPVPPLGIEEDAAKDIEVVDPETVKGNED